MRLALVVDDSRVVRKFGSQILENLGFKVVAAADGVEALECCRVEVPDLILLDWNMPVMDGMEFLAEFRRTYPENETIIIFCTTENDTERMLQALEAGASEFVMKPYDVDILKEKLQYAGLAVH